MCSANYYPQIVFHPVSSNSEFRSAISFFVASCSISTNNPFSAIRISILLRNIFVFIQHSQTSLCSTNSPQQDIGRQFTRRRRIARQMATSGIPSTSGVKPSALLGMFSLSCLLSYLWVTSTVPRAVLYGWKQSNECFEAAYFSKLLWSVVVGSLMSG